MGNERTATDRVDAVQSRLETFFENPSVERVFRDDKGKYKHGLASIVISNKAFVVGLHSSEFKVKVQHELDMRPSLKDKPDDFFVTVRDAAVDWRTVDFADKRRSERRGEASAGARKPSGWSSRTERQKSGKAGINRFGHVLRVQKAWPCFAQRPFQTVPRQDLLAGRCVREREPGQGGIRRPWTTAAVSAAAAGATRSS